MSDYPRITADVLSELLLAERVDLELQAAWSDLAECVPELGALAMEGATHLHKDNVAHTIAVTAKTPARLRVRLLALFHDVGKPVTRVVTGSTVTFHGHEAAGGPLTKRALVRLGYDEAFADEVASLVAMSGDAKGSELWTDAAIRRFDKSAGKYVDDLLDFMAVDVTSKHLYKHEAVAREVAVLRERIAAVRQADEAAAWRPVVSGDDIMRRYDLAPSREVGRLLQAVIAAQKSAEATGAVYTIDEAFGLLDGILYTGSQSLG